MMAAGNRNVVLMDKYVDKKRPCKTVANKKNPYYISQEVQHIDWVF